MRGYPAVGDEFDRYRVDRLLGRGGMGVVYVVTHTDLDLQMALKLLAPELADDDHYRRRFLREAKTLARLNTAHIVRVHDAGERDGLLFIATEFVPGGDLEGLVRQTGPLRVHPALEIIKQVAEGLAVTHEAGILHRDIKPSNVLLRRKADGTATPVLCDLGIATIIDEPVTQTVGIIGTPTYMAPERHLGNDATTATDLYALGCVLWMLLTGGPPYTGTIAQLIRGHVSGPIPQLQLPRATPEAVRANRLLTRLLAKDPADRPRSAAEVVDILSMSEGAHRPAGAGTRADAPTTPGGPPSHDRGPASDRIRDGAGAEQAGPWQPHPEAAPRRPRASTPDPQPKPLAEPSAHRSPEATHRITVTVVTLFVLLVVALLVALAR